MPRKAIDWSKIKDDYMSSERISLKDLSVKYGIAIQTLKRHSSNENWYKDKKKKIEQVKKKIEEQEKRAREKDKVEEFIKREKIERIADKLLESIEAGTELFEKPINIAVLTGALKELKDLYRDIYSQPNYSERKRVELAEKKLENDALRVQNHSQHDGESGVVVLPEILNE